MKRYLRYPGYIIQLIKNGEIYLSKGYQLFRINPSLNSIQTIGEIKINKYYSPLLRIRLLKRFGRLGIREIIKTPQGSFICSVYKSIYRMDVKEGYFKQVFSIKEGGRPKGFVITPSGRIYTGEYWGNKTRRPLRIWASDDDGKSWYQIKELQDYKARHIHNLIWDSYRNGIWILTGDLDEECHLLFTDNEFKTITIVASGRQEFRACHLFCQRQGLYYGTDSENIPNKVIFLDPETLRLDYLHSLPGSSIYGCKIKERYYISTNVEPSKVNLYPYATLWYSDDLEKWTLIKEFKRDFWSGEYFGYGNIILPRVQGEGRQLGFTPYAVKKWDLVTFIEEVL